MRVHRRQFLIGCAGTLVVCSGARARKQAARSAVAITMDDPNTDPTPMYSFAERNRAILDHLGKRDVRAMLFVCGKRVDNPDGATILRAFDNAGHVLANHSYSHRNYNDQAMTCDAMLADIARCETLLEDYKHKQKRFRFPYLKEGETVEKRDTIRKALKSQRFTLGHVTIDTSDWAYDMRLVARLKTDPKSSLDAFRAAYIKHILDRAHYYDDLAKKVVGRTIKHTLLIHYNLISALFLGDLIDALRENGFRIVSPDVAYEDAIFATQPNTVPAGESLVWSLARANAALRDTLRYPGEDEAYETAALNSL